MDGQVIRNVSLDDDSIKFVIHEDLIVIIDIWCWRLERNDCYVVVSGEADDVKAEKLNALQGCSIDRIEMADQMMDTRFYIREYVLSTFVCSSEAMMGWGIYKRKNKALALYPPE